MKRVASHGVPHWPDAATEPVWSDDTSGLAVPARFEQVVSLDPDRIAFTSPAGETTSYGELSAAANRLAHVISTRSEDREMPVSVLARHPGKAITGMLATLKAGRMYVPLDPSDPPSRLEHILEDARSKLVVTAPEHATEAGKLARRGGEVIVIGRDDLGASEDNPAVPIDGGDLAYLLYTSGSTGAPKGVVHTHHNLIHKAMIQRTLFGMGRDDRVSMLFSPATGAATTDIYGSLLNGGMVCPYDLKLHGLQNLGDWLTERRITVLHIVPTIFRRFLDFVEPDRRFPDVKVLIMPGEPTYRRDFQLYRRHFTADCVLAPRLSSAETSVVAVDYIRHDSTPEADILPVGLPTPHTEVRVVDDQGRPVPRGETGQIEVESDHLALGYWDQPELTEEKFGLGREGRRLYRMGDLGRFLDDGRLEFQGRVDDRLKINGVTIEPREVERAIHRAGRFKEVAVVGIEDGDRGVRLTAYVVPEPGFQLPGDFRTSLAAALPTSMIPSATVALPALPLTPLGKVDKRSLPRPVVQPSTTVPARDRLETALASIWSEVTGHENLGVTDDFFEIGGTSIQALQAFALMGRRLGVDVPSTTILQAPTVAALADVIRAGTWDPRPDSLVTVAADGPATPFFCVHGGGGGVFFLRKLANSLAGNRPVYGLQAQGFEARPGPYRPVEELAANYVEELRAVQAAGPYLIGGLSFGGKVAYEMAQQLTATDETVALIAMLDTQAIPSDRGRGRDRVRRRLEEESFIGKASYLVAALGKRASRGLRKLAIRYFLARERALPERMGLRNLYFYPMHSKANREYQPSEYSGRVLMIAASGKTRTHLETWGELVRGGFDVVEVATPHSGLIEEPHVAEVAGHLQRFLDQADPVLTARSQRR